MNSTIPVNPQIIPQIPIMNSMQMPIQHPMMINQIRGNNPNVTMSQQPIMNPHYNIPPRYTNYRAFPIPIISSATHLNYSRPSNVPMYVSNREPIYNQPSNKNTGYYQSKHV